MDLIIYSVLTPLFWTAFFIVAMAFVGVPFGRSFTAYFTNLYDQGKDFLKAVFWIRG